MRKKERRELARKWAYEFARSGKYCNWLEIERAVDDRMWGVARQVLDDPLIRSELDVQCANAKASEYARSGVYLNWQDIERALSGKGLHGLRQLLDIPSVRNELDALCASAKAAKNQPREEG